MKQKDKYLKGSLFVCLMVYIIFNIISLMLKIPELCTTFFPSQSLFSYISKIKSTGGRAIYPSTAIITNPLKELGYAGIQPFVSSPLAYLLWYLAQFNPFLHIYSFKHTEEKSFRKTLWKKVKLLKMSNFTFFFTMLSMQSVS